MGTASIHLAIPSYNNAAGLQSLLAQAVTQNFASIRVLDDGSTDDTQAVVAAFSEVIYIRAEKNGGPVAAKNLVLKNPPTDGWILYLDSDMEIITPNIPEQLSEFLSTHPQCGVGVGRICSKNGRTLPYNRGYDLQPCRMVVASCFHTAHQIFRRIPIVRASLERLSAPFLYAWAPDTAHRADWVVEGFCFVRTDLFVGTGGYDGRMYRFHEGPDLCLRLRKMGYQVWFTPDIQIQDHDQYTGTTISRRKNWWRSLFIYYKNHPDRLLLYRWPRP